MFRINLVPEIQEQKQKLSRINYTTTVVAIICGGITAAVLIFLGSMLIANKAGIASAEKKITSLNNQLLEYKELEENVLSLENGLAGAKAIIDGSNRWTLLLPHIEKATPADIKFTKLALKDDLITASLTGRDVNSLARFVESFKSYEIYGLRGTGVSGDNVLISVDGGQAVEVRVKTDGQWLYPISFDPAVSHTISVTPASKPDETLAKASYDPATKEITTETGTITIEKKNLFSNVEVSEYKKENSGISFDATISFDGAILW